MDNYIIPPGETIKELLKERKITQKDLANYLALKESQLRKLLNGKLPIDENIAKKLKEVFDVNESFWLTLEQNYQEDLQKVNELKNKNIFFKLKNKSEYSHKLNITYLTDICHNLDLTVASKIVVADSPEGVVYVAMFDSGIRVCYIPEKDAFALYLLDDVLDVSHAHLISPVLLLNKDEGIRYGKRLLKNLGVLLSTGSIGDKKFALSYFEYTPECSPVECDVDFLYIKKDIYDEINTDLWY